MPRARSVHVSARTGHAAVSGPDTQPVWRRGPTASNPDQAASESRCKAPPLGTPPLRLEHALARA